MKYDTNQTKKQTVFLMVITKLLPSYVMQLLSMSKKMLQENNWIIASNVVSKAGYFPKY